MKIDDKRHITIFLLGASFVFYLLSSAWSAIFFVALPLVDPDWCQEWAEIQTGETSYERRCVAFKDNASEVKYYHNMIMVQRQKDWLYATLALGGLLGTIAFHIVPRWRGERTSSGTLGGGVALGVIAAFFGPIMFSWILPAPIHWFPEEFTKIHEARRAAALRELGIAP